ncbi:MAG TPA: divergent polysaccharide deacetylase family protein [Candidatus Babeliales bacterium]|nr:divergent polysaccharide deacetylase family protein [Candidatus Babeliales bacterium]
MSRWLVLVAFAVLAAAAGWWLLRPLPHPTVRIVRLPPTPVVTPAPVPTARETIAPTQSPSPVPKNSSLVTANPNGVKLALIVDDCGQWIDTERGFVALQIPLTLSVLPDVPYTAEISREAADAGKGVMLHLPMETLSGLNPGPGKVTTEMSDPQIVAQVESDLDQIPRARGVNNHEGSKATADERVMRAVIGVLAQRGDFFIDSRTNPASVGEQTAQALGVPTAGRDVFLDNRADVAYSEAQLLQAAAIAREKGSAIAIGHPRPTTLAAVRAMIPRLEASGIQFVLVEDLVATNGR